MRHQMRPAIARLARVSALCLLSGILALPALAEPRHGIAMYGTPALPPDFVALPQANPQAPKGGKLTLGEAGSFDSLNPFITKGQSPGAVSPLTVETLMGRSYDEPFSLYGLLAESIDTDEDRSFVEFTLREGARFSDGSPVTVDDVLWSMQTLGDPETGAARYISAWKKVAKAEATGHFEIRPQSHVTRIEHNAAGKVTGVVVEETEVERGCAQGTGCMETIKADLVVACIGYRSVAIPGVPFEEREGRFANAEGCILPGLYCVGWARRGPSGTIGTNRPDGYSVVDRIAEDMASGALGSGGKKGREGFDAIAEQRGLEVVTFRDWKKIEEAEEQAAREGAPREKFVDVEAMIRARG